MSTVLVFLGLVVLNLLGVDSTSPPVCSGGSTTYSSCDPSTKTLSITRCEDNIDIDPDTGTSPIFSHIRLSECMALSSVEVESVSVTLNFLTDWVGDVQVWLLHDNDVRRQIMGVRNPPYGNCTSDDVLATFYDGASGAAFDGDVCDNSPGGFPTPALTGDKVPEDSFSAYEGETAGGVWTVEVADVLGDSLSDGYFGEWTLTLAVSECDALPVGDSCDNLDPCIGDGVCTSDGECTAGSALTGTACDDYDSCTSPDLCAAGVCGAGATIDGVSCTVRFPYLSADCASGVCSSGTCVQTALGNSGDSCVYDTSCSNDVCDNSGYCNKGTTGDCCESSGLSLSDPHTCQCQNGCGSLMTFAFVVDRLPDVVDFTDEELCSDDSDTCCCNCASAI